MSVAAAAASDRIALLYLLVFTVTNRHDQKKSPVYIRYRHSVGAKWNFHRYIADKQLSAHNFKVY